MSWLRCFLIFVLELLLDPKFVDLVSLSYGVKENYIKSLCKLCVSSPGGSPLEGSLYGADERVHLIPHAGEIPSFVRGYRLFVGETWPHACENLALCIMYESISSILPPVVGILLPLVDVGIHSFAL